MPDLDSRVRPLALAGSHDRSDPGFRVLPPAFNAADTTTASTSKKSTRVDLYSEIGGWGGVWPDEFKTALDAIKGDVDLHIHSPGGDAFDGVALHNMLRQHDGNVDVTVDGLAASAASVVAMAGNSVTMSRGSQMMIHDAWGLSMGNAEDMSKMLGMLDKTSDSIASIYAAKAGGTAADWRTAMKAETWYSAEEAVDAGLADAVETETAAVKNRWDLKVFAHAGRDQAPDPIFPAGHRATREPATSFTFTNPPGVAAKDVMAQIKAAADRAQTRSTTETPDTELVGSVPSEKEASGMPTAEKIKAELGLSDEQVAKLRALFDADGTAPDPPDPTPAPEPNPTPSTPVPAASATAADLAKLAAATGAVLIDPSQLDEMRRMAALGQEAHNTLRVRERDEIINKAVLDGKIAPARMAHWQNYWDNDPEGARDALNRLAPNLIPVEAPGYAGTTMALNEADAAYKGLYGDER
jgi:ATP-dependent protease ClpP protease subunit